MKKLIFYWCIHHQVIVEPKIEPIKNRIKFIKKNKPKYQIPMRLKCLKKVKGKLPEEIYKAWDASSKARDASSKAWDASSKAWDAYSKARDAYSKASDAYSKASDAYSKVFNKHKKTLLKLHAKECPNCKFDWNKGIIFEED